MTADQALKLSRRLGHEPGLQAYEVVVTCLGGQGEWELLLDVFNSCRYHTQKLSIILLNWRARALLETGDFTHLYGIIDLFWDNDLVPTRRSWHLVLSGYLKNHDLGGARRCMEDMAAAGSPPDHWTHALIATLYTSIGPDEEVKSRGIEALAHIDERTATHMMNSLVRQRLRIYDLEGVFSLLNAFDAHQVGPIFRMLVASQEQHKVILPNRTSMLDSYPVVVKPDAITFAMFIDFYADLKEMHNCSQVLAHMEAAGVPATSRTVSSLIRAYFHTGHGGAAVQLLASMCKPQTTTSLENLPSPDGHTLALDVTKVGRPNRSNFNHFMRGALTTNGLSGAQTVLKLMQANGVRPDSKTTEIVTSHTQRVERAKPEVLMRLIRRTSPRVTLQDAHIILSATTRYQKFLVDGIGWDVTASYFSQTRNPQPRPLPAHLVSDVAPTSDILGGIHLPPRDHRTFRPIEQSLEARGVRSDRATLAVRMRHDAVIRGDMESATAVFQSMLGGGMHANQYHYSALLEGFVKAGDFESARDVMNAAAQSTFKPGVLMYTILIVGYARRKDPETSLQIFKQMAAAGIQPDVPVIDAVASAFFVAGAYHMCWRVLTSLWEYIGPLPEGIERATLKTAAVYFRSLHKGPQPPWTKTSNEFRKALDNQIALLLEEWYVWKRQHRQKNVRRDAGSSM
ncbi:unnamed protein product [Mycena citricolor]|uniref:PROP1-like PPR domain-containing protein n=1 Tax=Mycena citricolor TaxID=2018698 RepID=A0AAD2Q665_9AGAR|nr:unnamed protein product [Mycena citricolor]